MKTQTKIHIIVSSWRCTELTIDWYLDETKALNKVVSILENQYPIKPTGSLKQYIEDYYEYVNQETSNMGKSFDWVINYECIQSTDELKLTTINQNYITNSKIWSKGRRYNEKTLALDKLIKDAKKHCPLTVPILKRELHEEKLNILRNNVRRVRQSILGH